MACHIGPCHFREKTAPQVAFCFGDGIPEEDDYDDDFGDYDYEEGQESE